MRVKFKGSLRYMQKAIEKYKQKLEQKRIAMPFLDDDKLCRLCDSPLTKRSTLTTSFIGRWGLVSANIHKRCANKLAKVVQR